VFEKEARVGLFFKKVKQDDKWTEVIQGFKQAA